MLDMFINSISLFCKGRLFQDLSHVIRQATIGMVIAALIVIIAVKAGLALWMAIIIASLISGGIQPYLFRDLKYA
jgi:hypothetical protein